MHPKGVMTFCDVCKTEVTRSDIARHNKTQKHRRRLALRWETMPSDEEFTQFLHTIKGNALCGFERRLYRYYRGIGSYPE